MQKAVDYIFNIVLVLLLIFVFWIVLNVFLFASFKIPTYSMLPSLMAGDYILVSKPVLGARIFDVFASLRNEEVKIYRLKGFRKIKRNDILVFNDPYSMGENKIKMHILKYYIKRCIGLPGDTLYINNGYFNILGIQTVLGNQFSQKRIADLSEPISLSFPKDSILGWNIKDLGPFYVPSKGDSIVFDRTSFKLYEKLIEWEMNGNLQYKDSVVTFDEKPISGYCFKENYYFVAGDNGMDSEDSRYWGLLPEVYIVGKVWIIWNSVDHYGNRRWERCLKSIN